MSSSSGVDLEVVQSTLIEVLNWLQTRIDKGLLYSTELAALEGGSGLGGMGLSSASFLSPDRSLIRSSQDTVHHSNTSGGSSTGAESGRKKLHSYRNTEPTPSSSSLSLNKYSTSQKERMAEAQYLYQLPLRDLAGRAKCATEQVVLAREKEIAKQRMVLEEKEKELAEATLRLKALAYTGTSPSTAAAGGGGGGSDPLIRREVRRSTDRGSHIYIHQTCMNLDAKFIFDI
jgi:hypothetical protein